ncbi:MAG: prepilin-type N-terminal cleavage/methylation domain-containing protein [Planctomycetota bacterium]
MNARKQVKRKGFTLVEILIVVVILGILAAIVVPQFARATDDARLGNVRSQVQTLENQIELYRAREGAYPAAATLWEDLMTDQYIKSEPIAPFWDGDDEDESSVGDYDDAASAWWYDVNTGDLSPGGGTPADLLEEFASTADNDDGGDGGDGGDPP